MEDLITETTADNEPLDNDQVLESEVDEEPAEPQTYVEEEPGQEQEEEDALNNKKSDSSDEKKDTTKAFSERLKKEREKLEKEYQKEIEKIQSQSTKEIKELVGVLNEYGIEGDKDDIIAKAKSEMLGISVDEYKAKIERENKAQELQKQEIEEAVRNALKDSPEIERARQITYANDLAKVKDAYPEVEAKSVEELGDVFIQLMSLNENMDPVIAYAAQKAANEAKGAKVPASMGTAKSSGEKIKEFYSPADVDRLTPKDLENPTVFKNVRRSMEKW